jgi:hypothetical protein
VKGLNQHTIDLGGHGAGGERHAQLASGQTSGMEERGWRGSTGHRNVINRNVGRSMMGFRNNGHKIIGRRNIGSREFSGRGK